MDHPGNRLDTDRRVCKKGKANNSMERGNTEIQVHRMDLSSAGQGQAEIDGRDLRPAVDCIGC